MKKANFQSIAIGVESIHDKSLAFLNKGETFSDIESALRIIDEANISTDIFLLAGIPYETYQDMCSSLKYLLKHQWIAGFSMSRITPMLGTPYYEFAKNNNLLFKRSAYPSSSDFMDFMTPSPWVNSKEFENLKNEIDEMHLFLRRRNYLRRWFKKKNVFVSLKHLNAISKLPLMLAKVVKYAFVGMNFLRDQSNCTTK